MPTQELEQFLRLKGANLPHPIAVILAEDDIELAGTIKHHRDIGFETILVIRDVAGITTNGVNIFAARLNRLKDSIAVLNQVITACAGKWIYYCFNAEYLYFPYSETRTIKDAATFMEEERRSAVFTYSIDLYPKDLANCGNGIDIDTAQMDRNGYYGQERFVEGTKIERQPEIFGGLRWRFEEHIPWEKRRVDRISLFKATKGLQIGQDLRLSDPEMNTISCKWHNNMTMGIMSFRVAKALMHNPGSADNIDTFHWGGSQAFDWNATQLMELGFMEPGQWF